MPSSHIVLKEETRMLGAAQIIIGLIHCALGKTWIHLYINQSTSFSTIYLPIVFISGFPFLASLIYVISGIFAIVAEKKPSPRYPVTEGAKQILSSKNCSCLLDLPGGSIGKLLREPAFTLPKIELSQSSEK
ncbi:membrane-spanning 4-domains subfamily A member 8-like [Symphalangus syndactylus]|uniref:membrane-spanning 4-domains subfamily A member 8-like n=1 Tax=Symphalangus syndactylus TaxID=9590 RepID=UPI002442E9F8|nr:membrane-spanning 4-domains subfamily A member 8-like [Symphalangus syndactylus]